MVIKINFSIDPDQNEHVDFYLHRMSEKMQAIANQIQSLEKGQIWGYQEGSITPLEPHEIVRFVTNDGKVEIQTAQATYHTKERIYQWAQRLPTQFIQVSSGEIVNFDFVDHLELVGNGNIKLILKDQSWSFVSRRYLHRIKERLGI